MGIDTEIHRYRYIDMWTPEQQNESVANLGSRILRMIETKTSIKSDYYKGGISERRNPKR